MTTLAQSLPASRSASRWLALAVLALAQFLVVLDASIVNIALPRLGQGLGLDPLLLSWVITAYVLPFGGLLLLGGRLADRIGHRTIFLVGTGGFIAASLAAGLSPNGGLLLAARAVQGASAALLAPGALSLLMQLFPTGHGRDKALGIWGAVAGLGSVAGVLLGGVLTAQFGWASIFFINVPVGLFVLASIPFLIGRDQVAATPAPLDIPGALTVTAGLVAIVTALSVVLEIGFLAPLTLGLLAAGITLLIAFVVIEIKSKAPLVDFRILANRAVSTGNVAVVLIGGAVTGLFFALSLYMQDVLAYDAMTAGLSQLPLAMTLVVVAGLAPAAIARLGSRDTLVASLLIFAAGLVWLSFAPTDASFLVHLLGPSLLIGTGLGGAFVAGTELSVSGVSEGDAGLASGLVNTSQQIGAAIGLAVIFTISATRATALADAGMPPVEALSAGHSWGFLTAAGLALLAAATTAALGPRTVR
ncbi:MAG: MFS transporter [Alphaproteobacteria bacterium]|nr:MFS transporter [Alphaproteobacteria bacterium]MBU1562539.1 MFS transporter [Alphaproteobacteria bacterium]MBU2303996.1 MFS transporter [Alphaproteobacteria bacterium]MBU2369058.1 MFS transporter [Alphaproteobacteria bacterium]